MKKYSLITLAIVGLAAGSLQADDFFSGAVDDNWAVANNWYRKMVPDGNMALYVGCPDPNLTNVSARVYTGTSALAGHTWVGAGKGGVGSLFVEAGATFNGLSALAIGTHDLHFDTSPAYIPPELVGDENDWIVGGTGTLTVNGTVSLAGSFFVSDADANGDGVGIVHLNSGGLIEVTAMGLDVQIGHEYHDILGGHFEFYHAAGATLKVADNFHMSSKDGNGFYKMSGGTIITGLDMTNFGHWDIMSGTFWVDGDATVKISGPWGYMGFINHYPQLGDTPTLGFSGQNPKLTVIGKLTFTGALLNVDANTLVIPGWQWVTVVEANEIAEHTNYAGPTIYDGNDLTWTTGVDTNIWSMQIVSDTLQIKVSKRGDMDKDSKYTVDDINPFVMALTDPNAYLAQYGIDPNLIGDCDYSGKLDTDDISWFVALITGGASAIPEPACVALLAVGAAAVIRRRKRT